MQTYSDDPLTNAIYQGIKHEIRVAIEQECYRAAIILTYSGIDTMAFLSLPSHQKEATRKDFILWVNTYIKFPKNSPITGKDLYGARCGILHAYTMSSQFNKKHGCKEIAYMDQGTPEILYHPHRDKQLVVVSIKWLTEAFFSGIDTFLVTVFSDSEKSSIVEDRLKIVFTIFPNTHNGI